MAIRGLKEIYSLINQDNKKIQNVFEYTDVAIGRYVHTIRGEYVERYESFLETEFWGVRKEVIDFYSLIQSHPQISTISMHDNGREPFYSIIKSKYNTEPNSRVKRAMLTAFGKSKDKADVDFVKNAISNETNEYIISDGIKALSEMLPKKEVYDVVMPYLFRPSHRSIITQTVVVALDSADNGAPSKQTKDALLSVAFGTDIESRTRTKALTALLDYATDPEVTELAVKYVDYNFRETKQALIKLIGKSGNKELITFLKELDTRTTDSSINKSIADAIKELEG